MSSGLALHFPPREHEKAIFFNSVTICKISLLRPSTRTKPATESQKALSCLLDKRRAMYHARQGSQVSCCSNSSSNPSANGSADFPDNELSLTFQNTSSRVIRLRPAKALQERSESIWPVITAAKGKHLHRQSISLSSPHQPKSSFININSEELAEQIVSKTKLRLKRKNERKENSTTNRERFRTFTPILPSSKEHPHRICSQPNITGGGKKQQSLFSGQSRNNKCLPIMEDCSTKSKTTKDADFSSATNFLKMTLELKEAENKVKTLMEAQEKKRKLKIEEEKRIRRDDIAKLKAQQRAEIYKLNKIMAKYEKEQFEAGKV